MATARLHAAVGHDLDVPGSRGRVTSTRRALIILVLVSVLALSLLFAALSWSSLRHSRSEAIRDAREVTQVVANGVVQPAMSNGLVDGDKAEVARFDEIIKTRVLTEPVVRVKIWAPDGSIVYSDQQELIGQRFPLDDEELDALRAGHVQADISDLSKPENRFDRKFNKLLEVYLPVWTPDRRVYLFESYQRYDALESAAHRRWTGTIPALVVALVVLALVQLPLAASLFARVRQSESERAELLRRALDASDAERRRIGRDLHDGLVQRLAGTSMGLAGLASRLDEAQHHRESAIARMAADELRRSVGEVRSVLVDLYPANLHAEGLGAALADLVGPLGRQGFTVDLRGDLGVRLPKEQELVCYRAAQEAIRNAVNHAGASSLEVALERQGNRCRVTVADDGRGFDAAAAETAAGNGHFGLRMLRDLAAEVGGSVSVESTQGRGTTVVVEVPVP